MQRGLARRRSTWVRGLVIVLLGWTAMAASPSSLQAQRSEGRFGVGAQAGQPSGLTAKLYRHAQLAYNAAVVWNLRDVVFADLYRTHEFPLPNSPLHLLLGPGIFAGTEGPPFENAFTLGISGAFGLNFFKERFEVFVQATPRMRLYPETQARLGGSVGLRYFF